MPLLDRWRVEKPAWLRRLKDGRSRATLAPPPFAISDDFLSEHSPFASD